MEHKKSSQELIIYTIGHSNQPVEKFLELLKARNIEEIVDVRTIPKSRHNPQFNQDNLRASLQETGIGYQHLKKLGGLRHTTKDSINTGWKNASFRGFADYMQTADFEKGLDQLRKIAKQKKTAIMCAEAVPWRCHRSLIADALVIEKWDVFHIQSRKTAKKHELTSFLKVSNGQMIYN